MANKPTQPLFPLGLATFEQSNLAGVLNTGVIEHGPDAVLTLPEGVDADGLPSSVRYNSDSDEFEGFYENGGWLPLGGGGIRWEALPHAATTTLSEGRGYLVDNSTDVSTVVFPSPTRIGDSVTICDVFGKFSVHPLTIDPNGHPMYGSTEPMTLSTDSVSATFTWSGDVRGWIITAGVGLGQGRVYSRTIFTETVSSDTTQITLATNPSIVDVYVDGKRLPESKYSLSGFNVDFSPAIASGSMVQIIQYVPIQLGVGGGSGSGTVITWIYNGGAAAGGETQITLDVDAEDVSEIYVNGFRQQKELGFKYDAATRIIMLADQLEAGDEVVVVINGDPTLYNQIDRTPNEVARAANVPVTQVILTSDTVTKLGGKTIIYDVNAQKIWGLPSGIPAGASIISVSGTSLTYAPGNVVVTLVPYAGSATELESRLSSVDGTSIIQMPNGGKLKDAICWVTPEQFGAVGDGVADDIVPFTQALASGLNVKAKKGARYRLNMTELNVLTPATGVIVDMNGATIVVPNRGFLVFLLKNAYSGVINATFEYRGGAYPSTVVPTTRYGIVRSHEASFCGFIGFYSASAQYLRVENVFAYGNTDSDLYDFVVSGYEGNFYGSKVHRIRATHYSGMIMNNMHGVELQGLYGSKRHNKSSNIYGPSHLAYVGINGGSISDVYETGTLLSNESTLGYAGATVQTTGINGARISNICTTMSDVGALSVKLDAIGFVIDGIYSKSPATFSQVQALVEFQTNLQPTIQDGYISNVRVFLPAGNLGAVGYRHGGTRVKGRNISVDVPYTDDARTAEVAFLVTADYADLELDVRSSKTDSKVLLSAFNYGRLQINNLNNPISLVSGNSISGPGWGESTFSEVFIADNPTAAGLSTIDVAAETKRKCIFNYAGWMQGDLYRHSINNSVATNISLTIPVRIPPTAVSSEDHNILAYSIDLVASSIDGAQGVISSHVVFLVGNAGSVTGTIKDVNVQQLGAIAIVPTMTYSAGVITVTVTRQASGSNLRDLTVRARLLNNKPHV